VSGIGTTAPGTTCATGGAAPVALDQGRAQEARGEASGTPGAHGPHLALTRAGMVLLIQEVVAQAQMLQPPLPSEGRSPGHASLPLTDAIGDFFPVRPRIRAGRRPGRAGRVRSFIIAYAHMTG